MTEQITPVKTQFHTIRKAVSRRLAPSGIAALLGLSTLTWIGHAVLMPPSAIAYTTRVSLFLVRDQDESFESLLRRAEITARAGVQRSFDIDILATQAIVTVVAENQGVTVPILTVEVERNQWRNLPDVEYWAKYYQTANALLGF
ncbi:MAG TPA: hypothetical protein V6D29_19190 [Leptolyngbyaceae cyanobacterium]